MYRALLVLVLVPTACSAADPPLRFSVSDSWSMPLAQVNGNVVDGGILYDLMSSLARQVGRTAQFRILPKPRVQEALDRGEIDVRCYSAQAWLANRMSGDYIWSLPLLVQRDVLVSRDPEGTHVKLDELPYQRIGAVHGYSYAPLDPYFSSKALERDDARNQEQVLQKLLAGRYAYAITNSWALDWFNRNHKPSEHLSEVAVLEVQPVGCIARDDPAVPAQRIMRVLLRMKMSGEVERIIAKYQ